MLKIDSNAALVLIDVQLGFEDGTRGERNNPEAEQNIAALLSCWRATGRPVRHVRHSSTSANKSFVPGTPGHEFKPEARPMRGEQIFEKTVNSGFIGTGLEVSLHNACVATVVIAGLTTNHCVSTTARMAGNLGFKTFIVDDASATFARATVGGRLRSAKEVHEAALSDLHGEFGTVVSTRELLDVISNEPETVAIVRIR